MKIISLQAENVKRLHAVSIKPDGTLIVIGGKNGEGKTSVLDAIWYALGGRAAQCEKPVREGAKKALVELDLGDLKVRRTITPTGGGTITVSGADGAIYPAPQALLNRLTGKLAFDPLEFARMKPAAQLATLKDLVGLDFSEIDAERKQLYDQRTEINREAKTITAKLESASEYPDAPAEEVSIANLMEELEDAQAQNREREELIQKKKRDERDIAAICREIKDLQNRIRTLEGRRRAIEAGTQEIDERLKAIPKIDCAPWYGALKSAEETNNRVRSNREREAFLHDRNKLLDRADELTKKIEALDDLKARSLEEAVFPIEGLSFSESGVLYNGLPFDQASSAEQLRVSVAMGLAMNPKLRVLLIRDGSLLDEANLRMIAEMADKADAQVWIERVGEGKECSIVIEDGAVK